MANNSYTNKKLNHAFIIEKRTETAHINILHKCLTMSFLCEH